MVDWVNYTNHSSCLATVQIPLYQAFAVGFISNGKKKKKRNEKTKN